MLGAIIGDIVGSRWEFNPTNNYDFEWLSDENNFTDDTICTAAVADALLKGRDFGESIHEWCNRYPHPMGGIVMMKMPKPKPVVRCTKLAPMLNRNMAITRLLIFFPFSPCF